MNDPVRLKKVSSCSEVRLVDTREDFGCLPSFLGSVPSATHDGFDVSSKMRLSAREPPAIGRA